MKMTGITFLSTSGIWSGFPFWSAISKNGVVAGSSLPSDGYKRGNDLLLTIIIIEMI